jgi:antirestriction protein
MQCRCQIIEQENNSWIIALSECINGCQVFGPFSSKYEVDAYIKTYLDSYVNHKEFYDFEHPDNRRELNKVKGPPYKYRYWDFEDYKVLAWRNAGFRSRR